MVFPRIRLRISVFAIPILLLMLWLEGALPFAIVMLSAGLHELGHIIALRRLGYLIRRLDILPMGALIVCPEGIPHRDEFKIAIAGPLFSVGAAFCALGLFLIFNSVEMLFALTINLVFGFFNLLPVKKLDGGKALFSFVAEKWDEFSAERISRAVSTISTLFFLSFVVFCAVESGFNWGAVLLCMTLVCQLLER